MKQGTVSILIGCHSPIHSILVVISWYKIYHRVPKPWELVCIFLHDVGHIGTSYLVNYDEKRQHHILGARIAKFLFGQKGYDLIAGHNAYEGQPQSDLYLPDKYSYCIAPDWWLVTNTWFERLLVRPGYTGRQSGLMFKKAAIDNWQKGLPMHGHEVYLRQWRGEE